MAEERIDSLSIEIVSSAEKAVKGLDNIAKSTDKVGKALKNVKTSGLDKVSKDAVDSAKSIENLNSRMESLFAKGEAAGKKFFDVDQMGIKELESKLKTLKSQYSNAMDTINTKLVSGISGGTTFDNQVIQAGKLATRIDMVKERLDALKSTQDSMKPVDFWDRADWNETPIDTEQVGQALSDMEQEYLSTFSEISSEAANVGQNIQEAMQAPVNNEALISIKEQIAQLKDEQNQIGQAIQEALNPSTDNSAAREFEEVGVETEKATSAIQRLKEWMHSGTEDAETMKEAFSNLAKFTASSIFDLPKNLAEQFKKATSAIRETKKKLDEVKAQGTGQGTQQSSCSDAKQQNACPKEMDKCFKKVSKSSKAFSGKLKDVGGFMKKLVPNAKSLRGALSGLGLTNNKLIKSLTRTGKMLRLMLVRMALRGVITGAKEGFQNLIQYSDSTKASMQQLVSSLDYLKNSFAAAFAPAINVAAPILSKFIDYLVSAVNQINQLVSSLLGFSTWTKATKLVSNYGNAVGGVGKAAKETNKQLQPFDELNNLTMNQGSGAGGGSGAGTNYADMFTTEEVDGYWKSIADRIKDSWNFDDADFTWLGASLGEKISEQLDGLIDKHPKIKDNAREIGKALGTTITGFVETPDLGYKVGTVIGNAIDTAVTGLDGFVSNVHWDSVGTFIGEGINGIVQTDLINDAFNLIKDVINGGIDLLWSTGNSINFKEFGGKLGEGLSTAIEGLETDKLGEALSTWIRGGLQAITEFLYKTDFEEVGQKLADFLSGIDWGGLAWDLLSCAEAIADALVNAIKGLWNNASVLGKIGLAIAGLIGFAKISSIGLNLTNATVTATGTNAVAQTLGQKLSAACTSFFGASPLTVAVSVAVSWKLGESVGKQLGNELFSAIADEDLSKYYKDFHWWGEGGFFDEVTDDIDITRDAIQNMYNDAVNYFHGDDFETTGSFAKSAIGYAKEGANKTRTKNASGDGYTGTSGKFGSGGFASILSDMTKTYDNLPTSQNKVVQGSKKIQTTSSKEGKSWTSLGKLAVNGLTSIVNNENKATKSTDTFSKSYQSNSDKVTKATTGMSNNIATGADTASKTVDAKFQYMKQMATAHTEEQRKAIETKYGQMLDTTKTNTDSMSSDVLSKFSAMDSNATTKSSNMLSTLKSKFAEMKDDASTKSGEMKNALNTNLSSMNSDTTSKTKTMTSTLSTWSSGAINLIKNTKADAKFGVNTPSQSSVQNDYNALTSVWKDPNAAFFGVNTPSQSSVQNDYNALTSVWKDPNAAFFGVYTPQQSDVKSIWKGLSDFWQDKDASFNLEFGADADSTNTVLATVGNKIFDAFAGVKLLKSIASSVRKAIRGYARGGVFDSPHLGIFGEAGTEAVVPLERNTQWISKLSTMVVAEMPSLPTYQSSSNESAILEQNRLLAEQNALLRRIAEKDVSISSRDVFNAVRIENDDFINRTGASPFFV